MHRLMATASFPMITIITDKELPAAEVGLWIKAQQAVEAKNYKYAVSILRTLIKRAPGFLKGRQVLRACEVKVTPDAGRKSSILTGVRLTTTRRDPETTITTIEDELEKEAFIGRFKSVAAAKILIPYQPMKASLLPLQI